jgi:hypothetical protein
MKFKISNKRFTEFIFKLLNEELKRGRFRNWEYHQGFFDITKDDEYNGAMVVVDEEEIKIYPALYKTMMDALGMNVYQLDDFLTLWATTELPKLMPGKKFFFQDKFVDVIH